MSIKVNVGGEIFETTVSTLKKINYFKYILEDTNFNNTQIIFVNRSKHIFKHVLALAIDDNYSYPFKYKNELDFYDITYDVSKLRDPLSDINKRMDKLDANLSGIKKCKYRFCTNVIAGCETFFCKEHEHLANACLICDTYCQNSNGEFYCKNHKKYG